MTDEQIKQNAELYAELLTAGNKEHYRTIYTAAKEGYETGAHSRDEEIEELQKENLYMESLLSMHRKMTGEYELKLQKLHNPWISVEELLPDIGQKVITITNKGKMLLVARTTQPPHKEEGGWRWEHYIGKVTHWMPIPQIKKGE